MIFKPVLIEQILAGRKTVTRRPVNGTGTSRYEVGKTYAVQPGMARPTVARIRVLDVRREMLGEITDAEARLEGFPLKYPTSIEPRLHFLNYWRGLYGGAKRDGVHAREIDLEALVWRIEFEVAEHVAHVCPTCNARGTIPIEVAP